MGTYETSVEDTILDRQPIYGRIQVTMSDLKLGYLHGVLCIEQTKLQLLSKMIWLVVHPYKGSRYAHNLWRLMRDGVFHLEFKRPELCRIRRPTPPSGPPRKNATSKMWVVVPASSIVNRTRMRVVQPRQGAESVENSQKPSPTAEIRLRRHVDICLVGGVSRSMHLRVPSLQAICISYCHVQDFIRQVSAPLLCISRRSS